MELVDGNTLAQLLEDGSLPLKKAVRFALEIARALEAAHEKGVIHRDLKPANVMITPDDRVKVLDFGLAKAIDESSEASDLTHSPTLAEEKTREGVVLGTAPYMSPEQVEGMPLDPRTDIFSFGSLIYEMVTGRRAFPGKSQARVLAGILAKEPRSLGKGARGVPQQLEWVVARCLRKDPERRFQHMRDLRLALEDVLQEMESPRRWRHRFSALTLWQFSAAALALAAVLFGGLWWGAAGDPARLVHSPVLTRVTSVSGLTVDPAMSRRGRLLGYASDRSGEGNLDIWVQQLGGGGSRRTRDPADDRQPSFHPDGTRMVFRSERRGGGTLLDHHPGGRGQRQIHRRWGTPSQSLPAGQPHRLLEGTRRIRLQAGLPLYHRLELERVQDSTGGKFHSGKPSHLVAPRRPHRIPGMGILQTR